MAVQQLSHLGEQVGGVCSTNFRGIYTAGAVPGCHPVWGEECERVMWHQVTGVKNMALHISTKYDKQSIKYNIFRTCDATLHVYFF